MSTDLKRDDARKAFADAGLTYDVLTPESMRRLRTIINEHMTLSRLIKGRFRCRQRAVVKDTPRGRYAELRCRSDYFDNREAVSFNTDGFIGFAGWADDTNVQPILKGFTEWVGEVVATKGVNHGE